MILHFDNGNFAKMQVQRVLPVRYRITQEINPVTTSRNIYDNSGLYPLQQPLLIGSYVKFWRVRYYRIDRYRITQEQFQYQGVQICMTFWTNILHQV